MSLNTSRNKYRYNPEKLNRMSHHEAVTIWDSLTPQQQYQFKEMISKMQNGELMLTKVNVDDNEQIQNIVLEPKDKPSKPTAPFAKYFPQEK